MCDEPVSRQSAANRPTCSDRNDSAIRAASAGAGVQVQPALELVGSLTAVRGYSPEAARELKVAEETASDIVELIEQELD